MPFQVKRQDVITIKLKLDINYNLVNVMDVVAANMIDN